jgi:exocyst complex component 1
MEIYKQLFSQANIHSFIESDDRVALVLKFLDEAILELDNMDSLVSSYKIHLNASQLLVPSNVDYYLILRRPLTTTYCLFSRKTEVFKCRHRINAPCSMNLDSSWYVYIDICPLFTNSWSTANRANSTTDTDDLDSRLSTRCRSCTFVRRSCDRAVQSITSGSGSRWVLRPRAAYRSNNFLDMAATMERLEEYRTYNAQFCKRLYDYLCIMFTAQVRPYSPHAKFCLKPQTSM